MAIYNFELHSYFEGYKYISALIRYRRNVQKLTKVKVSADLEIPFTTYRRLEDDPNYGNEVLLKKTTDYFEIDFDIDKELVNTIQNDFNSFFNYTYFGDLANQKVMYDKLMVNNEKCINNILLIFRDITKFIYYISNVMIDNNIDEIYGLITTLNFFQSIMSTPHKIIYNTYLCSFYAYIKNKSAMEKLAYQTIRLASNDEVLKTIIIYQLSIIYFMLGDWSISLYYALQIKSKLEYTNNFNRLIYLKYNIAMIFYKISNYDESIDYLNNILNYAITANNSRLDYNSNLLYIYCLIKCNEYNLALRQLTELFSKNENKGELIMLLLYLYHKTERRIDYIDCLKLIESKHSNQEIYEGYYYITKLNDIINKKGSNEEVKTAYKEAEPYFNALSYCNFIDIIKLECMDYLKRTSLVFS